MLMTQLEDLHWKVANVVHNNHVCVFESMAQKNLEMDVWLSIQIQNLPSLFRLKAR